MTGLRMGKTLRKSSAFQALSKRTRTVRHLAVKLLAPRIFEVFVGIPRPMIKFISQRENNKRLVGVEIGVSTGANARRILELLPIKMLYLVDPYLPYLEEGKIVNTSIGYPKARAKLAGYTDKIKFILKESVKAKKEIPDDLDFVYIDGNHSYEAVKQDIAAYYPKVKKNGVIGGHDFTSTCMGVCKAVFEFAETENLDLHGLCPDWWIIK